MPEKFKEFKPESPEMEQAKKISESLSKLFAGKEHSGKFESRLWWDLDKMFVESSPGNIETPAGHDKISASGEVLSAIEQVGNKEKLSDTEQEIMNKLGKYFGGVAKRSKWIENGLDAVGFLENIPSSESVSALQELSRNPLSIIEPKEKSISRNDPFVKNLPGVERIEKEEVIRTYIGQIIQPGTMRSLIILKNKMGLELTSEEKGYYEKNIEKF